MTAQERVERIVSQLTWIPLSVIEVQDWPPKPPRLAINLKVFDSYNPTEPIMIGTQFAIPNYLHDDDAALRWVHKCLREVAVHECDEWIVYAGQRPFDPHRRS